MDKVITSDKSCQKSVNFTILNFRLFLWQFDFGRLQLHRYCVSAKTLAETSNERFMKNSFHPKKIHLAGVRQFFAVVSAWAIFFHQKSGDKRADKKNHNFFFLTSDNVFSDLFHALDPLIGVRGGIAPSSMPERHPFP